jgi:hypothetical protein
MSFFLVEGRKSVAYRRTISLLRHGLISAIKRLSHFEAMTYVIGRCFSKDLSQGLIFLWALLNSKYFYSRFFLFDRKYVMVQSEPKTDRYGKPFRNDLGHPISLWVVFD